MSKITVIFEDGTPKELSNVDKVEMAKNGIGYCLPVSEWHGAFVERFNIRRKKENLELQKIIEDVPNFDNFSIEFICADEIWMEDDEVRWDDHFIVSYKGESEQVDSSNIQDALEALVKLANES